MKKNIWIFLLLTIVLFLSLASCVVDTGYRTVDITSVYTDPEPFNTYSEDDYTFSVDIDYGNYTLQKAIISLEVHKGDDYYTMATKTISTMDSDSLTLSFTDNASNWTYRSEYSFYAYIYSSDLPVLSQLTGLEASNETVFYFTP